MSNKDINIIFFGNTDFSNPTLLACNNSFNLKAVVTNKSKKMGRGQKILDTPVMTLAKEENLKIIEELYFQTHRKYKYLRSPQFWFFWCLNFWLPVELVFLLN